MIGLVADIISFNRRLIEDTLYRVRKMELTILSERKYVDEDREQEKKLITKPKGKRKIPHRIHYLYHELLYHSAYQWGSADQAVG